MSQAVFSVLCRDCLGLSVRSFGACPICGSERALGHPELEHLDIAHIDCDAFYASVEKRDNPALNDKPLIVGNPGGRGVVTTACYIARQFGPRSAMPMFKALGMCPHAVVIRPNMAKYKFVSQQIRAIFYDATSVIQPVSLDEAYLDFSNKVRTKNETDYAGTPAAGLADIARRIETQLGITVSIGLSYNKFLAKLASDLEKPRGFSIIGRAEAQAFLAPLSVSKINGVGKVTAQKLFGMGIRTIGQLQKMREIELVSSFGKFGRQLASYAHGHDNRKVIENRPAKSISAETTFSFDKRRSVDLIEAIKPLCERVSKRLIQGNYAGSTIVLKMKTSDFKVLIRNRQLLNPTQKKEIIYENAVNLIEREANGRHFRLIGVGVSDICSANAADPPNLFGTLG